MSKNNLPSSPVRYADGQFYIGSKPVLLLAGEIHYFRLDPKDWQDRLNRLRECGMNTVASYIPWLIHEQQQGEVDLDGTTHPRHNLKAFIELCEKNDFYLFLRPGPFIMAEMKNDGIPYWVYETCPDAIPRGFEGVPPTTPTLDYTAPSFLKAAKSWYRQVMGLIAQHTPNKGGSVIAVQLDNEIGMLSWVSNKPDFTPNTLGAFEGWLRRQYEPSELLRRYPFFAQEPLNLETFMTPTRPWDIGFHSDFADFTRERYAQYVTELKKYAEEFGVQDILFVVNIHGTSGGRGFTYPIGVSQLQKTYESTEDSIISGSDVYFDTIEIRNFQDMYLCNGITEASNPLGKPLTCVEFSAGDSNFGDDYNGRSRSSSGDFKTRLAVAQGNKLINIYLFSGGENYRFSRSLTDGNDRIATTGEHHGFASLIGPEGRTNQNYPRLARTLRQISALEDRFAQSFIQYDPVGYGFIARDFATEYGYEKSADFMAKKRDLEQNRAGNVWESTVRALLLSGLALKTLNLERDDLTSIQTLVLPSSKYMEKKTQQKVLDFAADGGSLLLHGRIPRFTGDGEDCRILADAFEASDFDEHQGHRFRYDMAIVPEGFLSPGYEYHCNTYETFTVRNAQTLLSTYEGRKTCGFYKEVRRGRAVVISANYKCFLPQYEKIKAALGTPQTLTHDIDVPGVGVFMTLTKTRKKDEFFLYLINMDDIDKDFSVYQNSSPIYARPIHLPANEALTLPLNLDFGFAKIVYSTVELLSIGEQELVFRNTEKSSEILVETERTIRPSPYMRLERLPKGWRIYTDNRQLDEAIPLRFL
ncbi:MAG: beta-galactosidase [Treponema sp.]|jgi:beta-galactosidase|nr:beta-galactosidase [Treponema sp.]